MPDANVNIGGDASGAIAAVAAAQGAIDALHGKTVNVDVNVRQNGGGVAGLAGDLGRAGDAADRAGRAGRGMGDSFDRAGRSAHGMGDHVGRAADEADRLRGHLDAVNRIMGGGAPSSTERATGGMRSLADQADRARGSIGGIGSEGGRSLGAAQTGAIGAGRAMRELGSGSESAGRFMAGTSGAAQRVSRDLVPMAQGADGVYRSVSRMAGASGDVEKFAGSMRTIDAVGRSIDGGSGGSGGGLGGLLGKLGDLPSYGIPAAGALRGVGLAGGVAALGMGALGAAVAGVGLAGVAEDFAHNSQLMHAGQQAIRGFNHEFSAMKSETSAAGSAPMAGVAASMKGVGHELAAIGAANIAPVLNDVSSLGNQATQAMQKLAPSIGPATQGLTALAGAVIGAFGDSGPAVTSFANTLTQAAPGIQALTSDVINTASGVGSFLVGTAGGMGRADDMGSGLTGVAPAIADWGRSILGGKSISPLSAAPAGTDMFGNPSAPAASKGPVAPGQFDPNKPFSGMLPDGSGGFTVGTESGATPKPAGAAPARPQLGNFGPGSGGPATPPGPSGADILTGQRADIGLPPVGQPMYSGVGPRGPGQSVGAMPARIAPSLGMGSIAPLNDMQSAMQSQIAGGGAQTGAATVQHIQKAVQTAAPAATAGGASLGGAMNSGMAQGSNSSQTVIDTVTIKHMKHVIDIAAGALGVHSPSTEFDYLGRMTWAGFGQGSQRGAAGTFGSMGASMGGVLSAAQDMAQKNAPGYDGAQGETVTVKKPQQAMQYGPDAMARIDAHNQRAGALAAGREDLQRQAIGGLTHDERRDQILGNRAANHERALANLHITGHAKPSGDVNPFAGDQHQSLWNTITRQGPIGDLRAQFNKAGQNSTLGLSQGMTAHIPKIQAAGAAVAGAGHAGYKKKDKQSSPSAEWAAMGGNSIAGVPIGFAAGVPGAVSAMSASATAMSMALQGPLNDYGLKAGDTYAQSFIDGSSRELKKANYQSLGLPTNISPEAMEFLAATNLLQAGSGASTLKTSSGGPATVVIPPATAPPQTITLQVQHLDADGMTAIADSRIELAFDQATNTYQTL